MGRHENIQVIALQKHFKYDWNIFKNILNIYFMNDKIYLIVT